MKEHLQTGLVNKLRSIAERFHAHNCLRELLSECVNKFLALQKEWDDNHRDNK